MTAGVRERPGAQLYRSRPARGLAETSRAAYTECITFCLSIHASCGGAFELARHFIVNILRLTSAPFARICVNADAGSGQGFHPLCRDRREAVRARGLFDGPGIA